MIAEAKFFRANTSINLSEILGLWDLKSRLDYAPDPIVVTISDALPSMRIPKISTNDFRGVYFAGLSGNSA